VLPDDPDLTNEEPGDDSDPDLAPADFDADRKKHPAGWLPERAGRKEPVHFFVEEPNPNAAVSPFEDKRYGAFRKQMAWALGVGVVGTMLISILFWFRPTTLFFEEPLEAAAGEAPDPTPGPSPGLSPVQARQLQLDTLREQLRESQINRSWPTIDQLARAVLKMEPDDGEAWHALGWVLEKNGSHDEAAEAYGKAAKANFLRPQALLKRATMLRAQNKFPEAIKDMEESVRLDPDGVVAPNLLLVCKIQAGRAEEVRSEIKNFEMAGVIANADRYLLGKAALELHDGNFKAAAITLGEFRQQVSPALYAALVQDRFFDPFRSSPDVQFFLIIP